jgi:hypothetical protein
LKHQDLCRKYVNWLSALIQCSASYFDNGLVRFRARGQYFEYRAFHPQCIAGSRWLWPREFSTQADDAISQGQPARYQEAHSYSGSVPTARRQPAKDAGLCNRFVKVEGLGIELRGERFDSILVHVVHAGSEPLADVQILQI